MYENKELLAALRMSFEIFQRHEIIDQHRGYLGTPIVTSIGIEKLPLAEEDLAALTDLGWREVPKEPGFYFVSDPVLLEQARKLPRFQQVLHEVELEVAAR